MLVVLGVSLVPHDRAHVLFTTRRLPVQVANASARSGRWLSKSRSEPNNSLSIYGNEPTQDWHVNVVIVYLSGISIWLFFFWCYFAFFKGWNGLFFLWVMTSLLGNPDSNRLCYVNWLWSVLSILWILSSGATSSHKRSSVFSIHLLRPLQCSSDMFF